VRTYIVRIYRFEKDNPKSLVGVVEEVGVKGKKAFTNYDELWDILNSPTSLLPLPWQERAKGKRSKGGQREKEVMKKE